ncbi:MAG: hypothetical protein HY066_04390 [Betaproteobacteria bacterium]|nr:hypothetical protein [Betaproteobacteria bacterium]
MAAINLLVQTVGIAVALYLAFFRNFYSALALVFIVGIGHFIFMKISNGLMKMHQKTLSVEQLRELELQAISGNGNEAAPAAWRWIATTCGAAYVAIVLSAVWYFLLLDQ